MELKPPTAPEGDATGGIIPYKNPKALISSYFGIFSLIPFRGVFMGITATIYRCFGIKRSIPSTADPGQYSCDDRYWVRFFFCSGLDIYLGLFDREVMP